MFLYKMLGDYFRYIAEYSKDQQQTDAASKAAQNYERAQEKANSSLQSTHPMRLGLALNFSVFYYEIK